MWTLKNARIEMFNESKNICYVAAPLDEQSLETLKALGRGTMPSEHCECLLLCHDIRMNVVMTTVYLEK